MRAYIAGVLLLSTASVLPVAGCGGSNGQAAFPGDFYILKPGRSWTYDSSYWTREQGGAIAEYSGTFTLTRACEQVTYAGQPALCVETEVSDVTGGKPALAQELAGSDYYSLEGGGYYHKAHQTPGGSLEVFQPPRLWMPVPLTPGQTWSWTENWFGTPSTATCTATEMRAETVPLGTFDAVQLSAGAQASGGGNWLQYTWVRAVAPSIGVVRETRTSSESRATGEVVLTQINLALHSYSDTHSPPPPP